MPSFSGEVSRVANTRIFARAAQDKQFLVVQVEYEAAQDVALVLPLPTPPAAPRDAVRFVDLTGYPEFFADLANGFPIARSATTPAAPDSSLSQPRVGSYEAIFLPSRGDFAELQEQYRIADEVLDQLPEYHDYGFAVIQLPADAQTMPPVALEFPMRNPQLLYFPTVQIDKGQVAADSYFDHDLFCQARVGWMRSYDNARSFMDVDRAQGVIDPSQRVERFTVLGIHPNSDIVLDLAK